MRTVRVNGQLPSTISTFSSMPIDLRAELVEDFLVAGGCVLVVAILVFDHDLHDDECLFFGHEWSPRSVCRYGQPMRLIELKSMSKTQ